MAVSTPDLQEVRAAVEEALATRRGDDPAGLLLRLPPRDTAEVLHSLQAAQLATAISLLGDERAAEVLQNLDASDAARLLVRLSRTDAADVLEEMDPDDAADLDDELPEAILIEMQAEDADEVRTLLSYPSDSAASLMTREVVTVSPDLTADESPSWPWPRMRARGHWLLGQK